MQKTKEPEKVFSYLPICMTPLLERRKLVLHANMLSRALTKYNLDIGLFSQLSSLLTLFCFMAYQLLWAI